LRKLAALLAISVLFVTAGVGLASCGSSGESSGKEGGTLIGTFTGFPDYLDPALSYTAEGWTAMWDTYIPLLTYAHAGGVEGSKVIPGLATEMPKITNGGKTYTLMLTQGLKYSDGTPIKASDFRFAVERMIQLNSGGSPFYMSIVGAEQFQKTKKGPISGIKTNDKTGEIVINLTEPRGTFNNELGLLFVAPLPPDTPIKNLTGDPPPASGPYEIVSSEPGEGWKYERNPEWTKNNSKLLPELPSGHVDKIDVKLVRNSATQVSEIERGTTQWMQSLIPPGLYQQTLSKFKGTQLREEIVPNVYYFWMNMTRAPFNNLKVREAVNYAISSEAMERIYAGSLKQLRQVLPEGIPGHKEYDLYPYNMAKAKELIAEAKPSDTNITVWTDSEPTQEEAGAYYQDQLNKLGFNSKLKIINPDDYFTIIGNKTTPDLDTGWVDWYQDYPHPNDFFQPLLAGESILPTNNNNFAYINDPKLNAKIARLRTEQLGPKQEAEYAELDKEYMEQAPWAPYGQRTLTTFVSSEIDLDKIIFNPTFGQDLTSFQFK
jgi:peptide/nickel transport system substrate-binding protein